MANGKTSMEIVTLVGDCLSLKLPGKVKGLVLRTVDKITNYKALYQKSKCTKIAVWGNFLATYVKISFKY